MFTGIRYVAVALVVAVQGIAQNNLEIGAEAGPSLVAFKGGPSWYSGIQSTKGGFSGGLSAQYNFKKKFTLKSGMMYEKKGSATQALVPLTDETGEQTGSVLAKTNTDLEYVTIPAMVRINYGKRAKFFLGAGFYASYLLSSNIVYTPDIVQSKPRSQYDLIKLVNRFDYGFNAGAGGSMPVGKKIVLSAELRENFGLQRLYKSGPNGFSVKAINLLFGIHYKL